MAVLSQFTTADASQAMLQGLLDRIRADLKVRILERIEPDIEAALDSAIAAFKVSINRKLDASDAIEVIKVLIERR
jgi:hypothetical protein